MSGESGIILSSATKPVIEPIRKNILKKLGLISDGIREDFKIEGEEISINCPECIQKCTIFFTVKKSLLERKKKFKGPVRNVRLKSLRPLKDLTSDAITVTPDGFEISYKMLESGDLYMLEVEYEIESTQLIDNLVKRDVSAETPRDDKREYWMHAELKHLDIFRIAYKNIELKDIDFFVNVAIHQDVKTSIPTPFVRQLEVLLEWSETTDREKKMRLSIEHSRLKRRRELPKKSVLEFLGELQELFMPRKFKQFIEVKRDFRYHDCLRGIEYYNLPFPTWPKFMTVISRTDLNYERPAADGVLVYKHRDFIKEIDKIFSKT